MVINRVSATLDDARKQEVLEQLRAAKDSLPFLVSLTKEERQRLNKMGYKRLQYVNLCLQGATSFPNLMPSNINTPELAKDVALLKQLLDIWVPLSALLESVDDTMMAAGIDAIAVAGRIYEMLKAGAKTDASVKALVDEIKDFFPRTAKVKPAPTANNNPPA